MDPAPLVQSARDAYEKAITLLNDMTGWSKLNEIDEVVGQSKHSDGTDFRTFKADFYMDKPPKESSRYIYDNYAKLNEELNPED